MANPFDSIQDMFKGKKKKDRYTYEPETGEKREDGGDAPDWYTPARRHDAIQRQRDAILERDKPLMNTDGTVYARAGELNICSTEDIERLIDFIDHNSIGMEHKEKEMVKNILKQLVQPLDEKMRSPERKEDDFDIDPFRYGPFGSASEEEEGYETPEWNDDEYEYDRDVDFDWAGDFPDDHEFARHVDNRDTIRLFPTWLMEVFLEFEKFVRNKQPDGVWLCLEILSECAAKEEFFAHEIERVDYMNALRDLASLREMETVLAAKKRRNLELGQEYIEAKHHYESRSESVTDPELLKTIKKLADDIEKLRDDNYQGIKQVEVMVSGCRKHYFEGCMNLLLKTDESGEIAKKACEAFLLESRKRTLSNLPPQVE